MKRQIAHRHPKCTNWLSESPEKLLTVCLLLFPGVTSMQVWQRGKKAFLTKYQVLTRANPSCRTVTKEQPQEGGKTGQKAVLGNQLSVVNHQIKKNVLRKVSQESVLCLTLFNIFIINLDGGIEIVYLHLALIWQEMEVIWRTGID